MKDRILKGWSLRRGLFVAFGCYIMYTSSMDKSLAGIVFGIYFLSMGIFSFGCASGNCYGNSCTVNTHTDNVKLDNK
ncbi:MAG: hypothetical protein WCP65_04965 [Bacteroidota bacterium]